MADDALLQQLRDLLARGEKIEAIRVYRKASGAGLKEAKDYVEALQGGGPAPQQEDAFLQSLLDLMRQGQKIEAIKRYRERTGQGLKESKEAVEALARRSGLPVSSSGCGPDAAVFLLGTGLVWAIWR